MLKLRDIPLRAIAGQLELAIDRARVALLDGGDDGFLPVKDAEAAKRDAQELAAIAMSADGPGGDLAGIALRQRHARRVNDVVGVDYQHLVFAVPV